MIALATLRALLDSIAAGVIVFDAALGDGTPNTVSGAADANVTTLAAIDDRSIQTDLTSVFATRAALVKATALHRTLQGSLMQRAIDRHVAAQYPNLSAFLRANDTRVHENLNTIGFSLDSGVLFPAVSIVLGQWQGADFIDGIAIEASQSAEAGVELIVDVKGPTGRMLHLTLVTHDGVAQVANVLVPGNAAAGTVIPILAGQRFADLTAMTADGGDPVDSIRVRTIVERIVLL